MSEHASALELDEAAAGLGSDAVKAHLALCEVCGAQVQSRSGEREAVLADPQFRQTLARLPRRHTGRRAQRWLVSLAAGSLAVCATVVFVVRPTRELRAKGSASLELVTAAGVESDSPRVGEEIELRISGGPHRYALVIAIDDGGGKAALWPAGATASGALDASGRAMVRLRVTPGPSRIIAGFSDEPLGLDDVSARHATSPRVEFRKREMRPLP